MDLLNFVVSMFLASTPSIPNYKTFWLPDHSFCYALISYNLKERESNNCIDLTYIVLLLLKNRWLSYIAYKNMAIG
jgi:hypothetical protein